MASGQAWQLREALVAVLDKIHRQHLDMGGPAKNRYMVKPGAGVEIEAARQHLAELAAQQPEPPAAANRYVCGFAFAGNAEVALIRKRRPAWQAGRLNGCGGKIEAGETPVEAMRREAIEEIGVDLTSWERFCTLSGDGFEVHFFRAEVNPAEVSTRTDEAVEWHPAGDLPLDALPNMRWLIPMSDHLNRHDWPFGVRERCGGNGAIGRPPELSAEPPADGELPGEVERAVREACSADGELWAHLSRKAGSDGMSTNLAVNVAVKFARDRALAALRPLLASAPAEVAGWEELERAVERGLCTCGASCSAMRKGGQIVGTCGVEGCEWCSTSYQHLDEHPLADGHSESDWDDPACPVRQRMAEVLAAIKPLWPPARLEAVRELADATTALADEIEQGDDCGDKITCQLSDALVRVREAVLAVDPPKEEEHA